MPGDLDPLAARGERVAELVQHDRAEEQHRGGHRDRERPWSDAPSVSRNESWKQEDEQEQDEEPGGVDADADAEDPRQLERAAAEHQANRRIASPT